MEQIELIPNSKNDKCEFCPYWSSQFKACIKTSNGEFRCEEIEDEEK